MKQQEKNDVIPNTTNKNKTLSGSCKLFIRITRQTLLIAKGRVANSPDPNRISGVSREYQFSNSYPASIN